MVGVSLELPGIQAELGGYELAVHHVEAFSKHLSSMYENLSGDVMFVSIDGTLRFQADIDRLGHVRRKCYLEHGHFPATLDFEFESDQSYLPSLINELEALTHHYQHIQL